MRRNICAYAVFFFGGFLYYMQLVGTSTFPWHPKVPRHPKVPKLMPQRWLKRWASFGCHGAGWSSPAVLVGWSSVVALLGDGCWREIALSFNRALLFVSRFLLTSDLGCFRFWGGVFPQRFDAWVVRSALPSRQGIWCWNALGAAMRREWKLLSSAVASWPWMASFTRYKNRQACMYIYINIETNCKWYKLI